jgi:hypothetical protein
MKEVNPMRYLPKAAMIRWSWLLVIPSVVFSSADPCDVPHVLTQLRPGAQWSFRGKAASSVQWLDSTQSPPAAGEIAAAQQSCMAKFKARQALKAQARLDVKSSTATVEQKLQALIILQDLDL